MIIKKIVPILLIFLVFNIALFCGLSILPLFIFPKEAHICTFGTQILEDGYDGGKGSYNGPECRRLEKIQDMILLSAPVLSTLFTIGFVYVDAMEKKSSKKSLSPKK